MCKRFIMFCELCNYVFVSGQVSMRRRRRRRRRRKKKKKKKKKKKTWTISRDVWALTQTPNNLRDNDVITSSQTVHVLLICFTWVNVHVQYIIVVTTFILNAILPQALFTISFQKAFFFKLITSRLGILFLKGHGRAHGKFSVAKDTSITI